MRLMSFSLTTEAYRTRQKTVTRRDGWWFLEPGDVVMGVEKCQGIPKGGHVVRMHPFRVKSVGREPLSAIRYWGPCETTREGFPEMTPTRFIDMFTRANRCDWDTPVNRIEFEHLDDDAAVTP